MGRFWIWKRDRGLIVLSIRDHGLQIQNHKFGSQDLGLFNFLLLYYIRGISLFNTFSENNLISR